MSTEARRYTFYHNVIIKVIKAGYIWRVANLKAQVLCFMLAITIRNDN